MQHWNYHPYRKNERKTSTEQSILGEQIRMLQTNGWEMFSSFRKSIEPIQIYGMRWNENQNKKENAQIFFITNEKNFLLKKINKIGISYNFIWNLKWTNTHEYTCKRKKNKPWKSWPMHPPQKMRMENVSIIHRNSSHFVSRYRKFAISDKCHTRTIFLLDVLKSFFVCL